MYIATWNLNNRAGKYKFYPRTAHAAMALGADIIVFTEFCPNPKEREDPFRDELKKGGWSEQLDTPLTIERANRVLVASKLPVTPTTLDLPAFDHHFPSNLLAFKLPSLGLWVLAVRIPAYKSSKTPHLHRPSWEWLEHTAGALRNTGPALIIGDLNTTTSSRYFRRILHNGWHRAEPGSSTFFGHKGQNSEIDHILATDHCVLSNAECIQVRQGFVLSGSSSAISDHAALICRVETL